MVLKSISLLKYFVCIFVYVKTSSSQVIDTSNCTQRLRDHQPSLFLGYRINVKQKSFRPGDILEITIHGSSYFVGLSIYAVNEGNQLAGDWFPPVRQSKRFYKAISCQNKTNVLIVERRLSLRPPSARFAWASPMACKNGTIYKFKGAISKSLKQVQSDLVATSECISEVESSTCYLTSGDNCSSSICNFIITSTLQTLDREQVVEWENTGDRNWISRSGPTPSANTGPFQAFRGQTYLYSEASRPAYFRSKAILTTTNPLQGCFCLQFALSMNISQLKFHQFRVYSASKTIFRSFERNIYWKVHHIQFDQKQPTKISLEATRGIDWLGDIAIDDIRIYYGLCESS